MSRRGLFLSALIAGVLLTTQAQAFNLLPGPVRWPPDQTGVATIDYYIDQTPPPNWSLQDAEASVQLAWDAWTVLDCGTLQTNYLGTGQDTWRGFIQDGNSMISFNDPGGVIGGVGALAANVRWQQGPRVDINGLSWLQITETDTVYGNHDWGSTADIAAGCNGRYNFDETGVHEFGHGIGYGHSCTPPDACTDIEADAVMYPSSARCESRPFPRSDDRAMFDLSYGANLLSGFTADVTRGGPLPMSVNFVIDTFADATGLTAAWNFGDGNSSTELAPTHAYATEGIYTVSLDVSGQSVTCNGLNFSHSSTELDYITACDPAVATFTFSVSGKNVQFDAEAPGLGSGCVNNLNWDFGDGGSAATRTPIHTYEKEGTYEVQLYADGPAGDGPIDTQMVTIKEDTGCGCTIASRGPVPVSLSVLALLGAIGLGIGSRRRRL